MIPAGQQSTVASYYDVATNTTVYSNAVPFTVVRANPQLQCTINNYIFLYTAGQTLQFHMTFNGDNPNAPVDWQNATFTIRFVGNSGNDTYTDANLVPNSQAVVTTHTPSTFDSYRIDCIFNGTQNFAPTTTQAAGQFILVSARHPLGTVHFTSKPWPWQPNVPISVDIKIDPAPGGPVPNGFFSIRFPNDSTPYYQLGPNGESAGTLPPETCAFICGIPVVYIDYQGDP